MHGFRAIVAAILALLLAPAARAGDIYSYVDADGVAHFTNAPTDPRFRKVNRARGGASLYSADAQVRATTLPQRNAAFDRWREKVKDAAARYNLPEALVLAVMAVESNFDHRAVSEKGAMGLMQLMPGTAAEMFVSDAWDPDQNIEGGARYLRVLANQYRGDMVLTVAAYNAGPDAVRRAGDAVPNIPETQAYVRRVVALYQAFKAGK